MRAYIEMAYILVTFLQLRKTVFDFAQKELAPFADEIDRENNFKQLRVSILINYEGIICTLCISLFNYL